MIIEERTKSFEFIGSGESIAFCTLSVNKKVLQDSAEFENPDHTEVFVVLYGVQQLVIMLAGPELRVVPATIHLPLSEVRSAFARLELEKLITVTFEGIENYFNISCPLLAVLALNRHAGESGRFSDGDLAIIQPGNKKLQRKGRKVSGPHPADIIFHKAARVTYDTGLIIHHDQALITNTIFDFDEGVNIALGLLFVRTSPDYGTVLDLARKGKANPNLTIKAIKMPARLGKLHD